MSEYSYINSDPVLHLISREKARELGMKWYFTGKPCANGHLSLKAVANYCCNSCAKERRVLYKEENAEYYRVWREKNKEHLKNYREDNKEKIREKAREYVLNNAEYFREKSNEWRRKNPEKKAAMDRRYQAKNREYISNKRKEYYQRNKEVFSEKAKEKYLSNPEAVKERVREWKENNKERSREYYRDYNKDRRKTDPDFYTICCMRAMLRRCLNEVGAVKTERTSKLLKYSSPELRKHIEKLFLPKMSWEDGTSFHIDHIHPVSRYIREGITDPAIINALSNLAPMYPEDNLSKGSKTLEEWLDEKGEDSREWKLYGRLLSM